jgi:uncharacterized protein
MRQPGPFHASPLLLSTLLLVAFGASYGGSFVAAADPAQPGPAQPNAAGADHLIDIPRPGDTQFVVDEAELLKPSDVAHIKVLSTALLKEKATPIVVVTINSMAQHGGAGMRIETFARLLFDQWGVGHAEVHGKPWNTGILLLVSKGDRKARIELGAHWRRDQDRLCDQIMSEQIIPRFKQGDFSGGIVAGVEALDKMARGLSLPEPPTGNRLTSSSGHGIPMWLIAVGGGLLAFTVVSMIRRGSGGWAWIFWGLVFGVIGSVLYSFLTSNSRSSGGGGSLGGGSFGGGFSGGGGSTGSW